MHDLACFAIEVNFGYRECCKKLHLGPLHHVPIFVKGLRHSRLRSHVDLIVTAYQRLVKLSQRLKLGAEIAIRPPAL